MKVGKILLIVGTTIAVFCLWYMALCLFSEGW